MNDNIWGIRSRRKFESQVRKEFSSMFNEPSTEKFIGNTINDLGGGYIESCENALLNGHTNLRSSDVWYHFNELGTRGDWKIDSDVEINIGYFGCSFTFGEGVDEDEIFPNLISQNILPSNQAINMGYRGGDISRTVRYFNYVSEFIDLSVAVFTLPTWYRVEYIHEKSHSLFDINSLILNVKSDEPLENIKKAYYTYNNDNMLKYSLLQKLEHIYNVCQLKGIVPLFTSWDGELYYFISEYLNDINLLPQYRFIENEKDGMYFACDGHHPGLITHKRYADEILNHIDKYDLI